MPRSRTRLKQYGVRINGVLIRKSFASAGEARRWQRAQKELQDQIRSGSKKYLEPTLLSVQCQLFLESRKDMGSYGHQRVYLEKYILSRTKSQDKLLHELDTVWWKEIFGKNGELVRVHGLSPASHNLIRATVHKLYEDARREYSPPRAGENPIRDTPILKGSKKKLQILNTKEEIQLYINTAYNDRLYPSWGPYTMVKLNTGLRQQNLIPLRWKDWRGKTLHIREKWVHWKQFKGFKPGNKANEDEKVLGVNPVLEQALAEWRKVTPYPGEEDFIFAQPNGEHMTRRRIWEANSRTIKAAGLSYLSEHKLRHSYATHYLGSGGNIHDLKLNLFHSTVTTTEIYSHALESEVTRRAEAFTTDAPKPRKQGDSK